MTILAHILWISAKTNLVPSSLAADNDDSNHDDVFNAGIHGDAPDGRLKQAPAF